jgi:hypothetical protein
VKHLGWSTSYDDIAQSTSIIMGKNLTEFNGLNIGNAAGRIAVVEALQHQITAGKSVSVDTKLVELAEGTLAESAAAVSA